MSVFIAVVPVIVIVFWIALISGRRLSRCCADTGRPLEELVQLTAVEPNASAGGAVINFNTLPIGHDQRLVFALGTFHDITFRIKKEPRERGSKAHSLLPPTPNKANKLVNKLNTETNKLTVAST